VASACWLLHLENFFGTQKSVGEKVANIEELDILVMVTDFRFE
jgi:hypothetical protein